MAASILQMPESGAIAVLLLKSLVVVGATEVLVVAQPRRSASTRCLVLCLGSASLLLLPLFELVMPMYRMPVDGALALLPAADRVLGDLAGLGFGRGEQDPLGRTIPLVLLLWGAGSLTVAGQYGLQLLRRNRAGRRSALVTDHRAAILSQLSRDGGCRRNVDLRESGRADVPVTWGYLRPVILLPTQSANWTRRTLRNVLLHELAHVTRGDDVLRTIAAASCALWWFHPWAWRAAHGIQLEQEKSCDDLALGSGVPSSQYGHDLVEIARSALGGPREHPGVPLVRQGDLSRRIRSILDDRANRTSAGARQWRVACLSMLLLIAGLAAAEPGLPRALERTLEGSGVAERVAVTVSLQEATMVEVELFDRSGNRVRRLVDEVLEAGTHRIGVNAGSGGGRDLPAGTYFCRVSTGGTSRFTKLEL